MAATTDQQPIRDQASPEEIEVARAHAILKMAQRRLSIPEYQPATVVSFDYATGLAKVVLDVATSSRPTPCYSMIEDVDPSERVYVVHINEHTALIAGRAAPAMHPSLPDWRIMGGDGFTLGTGVTDQYEASYSKRGPRCTLNFTASVGNGPNVGDGRWRFPLPIPVSKNAGYPNAQRWIAAGEGTMWLGSVTRNVVFTVIPGDEVAYAWYNGGTNPIGGPSADITNVGYFPGGVAALNGLNLASGAFITGRIEYPVD